MKFYIHFIIILSTLFSNPVDFNINLLSIVEFNNDNNNYGVSDVWGYTDELGNEYAIVGYRYGTSILDISTNPQIIIWKFFICNIKNLE